MNCRSANTGNLDQPTRALSWVSYTLRACAGLAILAFIVATQPIAFPKLWQAMRSANVLLIAASCAGFVILMAIKSWRWTFLMRRAGLRYSFGPAFRLYLIGFTLGLLTPGRLGELARAAQLRSDLNTGWEPCLRTVIADRLFDLVFLAAIGPLALWAILEGSLSELHFGIYAVLLYVLFAASTAAVGKASLTWRPSMRWLSVLNRTVGQGARDLGGRTGLVASLITWSSYLVYFTGSYLLVRALGLDLSFFHVVLVTSCLSFVLLLPISIAGIGARDATLIFLLAKYGVSREDALAYSMFQLAVFTLLGALIGAIALMLAGQRRNGMHSRFPPNTGSSRATDPTEDSECARHNVSADEPSNVDLPLRQDGPATPPYRRAASGPQQLHRLHGF